jgi:hypothetical protein
VWADAFKLVDSDTSAPIAGASISFGKDLIGYTNARGIIAVATPKGMNRFLVGYRGQESEIELNISGNPQLQEVRVQFPITALYYDAIKDYNEGKLGKKAANDTVAKFEKIIKEYPESYYANKAHYFLARYYTRLYLKRKESSDERVTKLADKDRLIADKSNSTFTDYIEKIKEEKYDPTDLMNARYYLALNWVLLGNLDNAIMELNNILHDEKRKKYKIYVYEFYYTPVDSGVINRYFPSEQLALYTIKYLKEHREYDDNYKKNFEDYLNKFTSNE